MAACPKDLGNCDEGTQAQFACSLAALILMDEKSDVTAEKISTILKAAKVDVAAYWPILMAKNLEGKSVESFSGAAPAAAATAAPAAAAPAAEKKDDKKAPKKEEKKPEPEEDMDLGGMFD